MDKNFLELLSKKFPNKMAATAEIINLRAILALPKGTEYFLSDLHGEHEAFIHMIKSASVVIKAKIDEIYDDELNDEERDELAALIYNPEAEIKRRKKSEEDFDRWCYIAIFRLLQVCKAVSTKYTRSKVRKALPKYFGYAMDELLHADDEENRTHYYDEILQSIVDSGMTEEFICEMSETISMLAVDKLHIIGDVFDSGAHPDDIMDYLMNFHDVDFQWGNHDVVWMAAAAGHWASIANMLRMNISYNNFDMLEIGYGINLRALATFAQDVYGDDPCEFFKPKVLDENKFDPVDEMLAARMHKAIAICQFKIEGQCIKAHPEYELDNRLLLDKVDYKTGTVSIKGQVYELRDKNFPTVDPSDPYKLSEGEEQLMRALEASIRRSKELQTHIRFMFSHGSLYKISNGNLFYHGCIPMEEDGSFTKVNINGKTLSGKSYMDYLDQQIRAAYYRSDDLEESGYPGDLVWYLWLGPKSPLFGKDQMTTFERLFIADKATHKENTVPYYSLIKERKHCETILREFGLDIDSGRILNGHVPVKIKDGESPIKGEGKLFVIEGGISKAYQKTTGIAGYTFIYNSRLMALAEHKPYSPLQEDGTQEFTPPVIKTVRVLPKRVTVSDTEHGEVLKKEIQELRELNKAFTRGEIKEIYE
ncbi:MAG: fructose-1,6-bisphosphatase [Firmicutes bacterium]|nr:fructose-1,6-bisphosphatase [Bacillota bacterium]